MASDRPLVIALNGPPGVGKDTLAEVILSEYTGLFTQLSIKEPLLELAFKDPAYGHVISRVWASGAEHGLKDLDVLLVNGEVMTPRAMLINIATCLREQYGDDYFARKIADKIVRLGNDKAIIITDLGFECEQKELERHCDVILVHMERDGHTFENDSRNYLPQRGMHFSLSNNTDVKQLKQEFVEKLGKVLGFS